MARTNRIGCFDKYRDLIGKPAFRYYWRFVGTEERKQSITKGTIATITPKGTQLTWQFDGEGQRSCAHKEERWASSTPIFEAASPELEAAYAAQQQEHEERLNQRQAEADAKQANATEADELKKQVGEALAHCVDCGYLEALLKLAKHSPRSMDY